MTWPGWCQCFDIRVSFLLLLVVIHQCPRHPEGMAPLGDQATVMGALVVICCFILQRYRDQVVKADMVFVELGSLSSCPRFCYNLIVAESFMLVMRLLVSRFCFGSAISDPQILIQLRHDPVHWYSRRVLDIITSPRRTKFTDRHGRPCRCRCRRRHSHRSTRRSRSWQRCIW